LHSQVTLKTLSDSELGISIYPQFSYDASGGGGTGNDEMNVLWQRVCRRVTMR
jgi:hypothetical protein